MPQDNEFEDLIDELEQSAAYLLCVIGFAGIPAAIGRMHSLTGLVVGGGVGFIVGLKACPVLTPTIRKKLFSQNSQLFPDEFRQVVREMKRTNPSLSTPQVLDLIALERLAVIEGRAT